MRVRKVLLAAAIVAATAGAYIIRRPEDTFKGALWLGMALVLGALGTRSAPTIELGGITAPITSNLRRRVLGYSLLISSGLGGGLALGIFAREQSLLPWLFYIISVTAFAAGSHLLEKPQPHRNGEDRRRTERWLLVFILLLAAFLRLHRISSMPPGLYYDEANNALDALWAIETGNYPIYFEGWGGRGPLIMYSLAAIFRLVGRNYIALRLVPVFYGLAGVVAIYLLARSLWGERAGLIAAFLLAAMRWHVHFSRVAFDAITVPCFTSLSLYFLSRGLQRGRRTDYMWAGFFLGWGLMGYAAFRVVPLLAMLIVGWLLLRGRLNPGQAAEAFLILTSAAIIASAPLLFYALRNPEVFMKRSQQVYLLRFYPPEQRLKALLRNARITLLMFHQRGDNNPRHNLPDAPMLDPVTGVLLVLGAGTAFRRIGDWRYLGLLLWFALALQPGIWSIEAPQALRNIGVVAPIALICAAFLDGALEGASTGRDMRSLDLLYRVIVALALAAIALINYHFYFYRQARDVRAFYAFHGVETTVGKLVASLHSKYRFYSIYNSDPTVRFFSPPRTDHRFLDPMETLPLREPVDRDVLYLVDPRYDPPELSFRHWYPYANITELRDPAGKVMLRLIEVDKGLINGSLGLRTRYYKEGRLVAERIEPSPDIETSPGLNPPFMVEKTGSLFIPQTGRYRLASHAGLGCRFALYGPEGPLVLEGSQEIEAVMIRGWHRLEFRCYIETAGQQAEVSLSASPDSEGPIPLQLLNVHTPPEYGLRGYYYKGLKPYGLPVFSRVDPYISFRWHIQPLPAPFNVIWRGYLKIEESGPYEFALFSNSPSSMELDGQPVLESSSEIRRKVELYLEAGLHPITVTYREPGGYSAIHLFWRPPGKDLEPIPPEVLIPDGGEGWKSW